MGLNLRVGEGTVLNVPATLTAITTYVLLEQEQWFEKELSFLLKIAKPEMTAIDIGANLGVYALAMARRVSRVVAYEPGAQARAHLEIGRALNAADALEIVDAALSDTARQGRLKTQGSTELGHLSSDAEGEPVAITSLDAEDRVRAWSPDIVKLDAEGEELRIVQGGRTFFAQHSPLVMFELRTGESVNTPALDAFKALGYRLYRSLPCAAVLVPCDTDRPIDAYELNLFAAKPDRAAQLACDGFLIDAVQPWSPDDTSRDEGIAYLKAQPFALPFAPLFEEQADRSYRDALAGFAAWRARRDYGALLFAASELKALCETEPKIARLSTLARIAWEAGERDLAVKTLKTIRRRLKAGDDAVEEPFWPASDRSDGIAPRDRTLARWFLAQALEQEERLSWSSSYWGKPAFDRTWLRQPWVSTEMLRRHTLDALRKDPGAAIPDRLHRDAPDHLNADLWRNGTVARAARGGET